MCIHKHIHTCTYAHPHACIHGGIHSKLTNELEKVIILVLKRFKGFISINAFNDTLDKQYILLDKIEREGGRNGAGGAGNTIYIFKTLII